MTFDISKNMMTNNNDEYYVEIETQYLTDESIEDTKYYDIRVETKDSSTSLICGDITNLSEYIIDFDLGDLIEENGFDSRN